MRDYKELVERLRSVKDTWQSEEEQWMLDAADAIEELLPSTQPDVPDINVGDVNKFIDGLEEIFAGQRERHVDDSVCGLCEYDGAYIGQSGDWCNECPGFDRDDCFKLSDKYRKKWIDTITNSLPSAQIEQQWRVIEKRPMDAEERDYWEGMHNCDYSDGVIYANIPDDGQKVLVCYYNGAIDIDEFVNDNDGCYFDSNGDMEGIVAWMPRPEPYKEEGEKGCIGS